MPDQVRHDGRSNLILACSGIRRLPVDGFVVRVRIKAGMILLRSTH
jgi:hypothetical protein